MISRTVWTANSDETLTPELMAVNPESYCRTPRWRYYPAVRLRDTVMHGGHRGRERIPRNFGPPTDDEPFQYELSVGLSFNQM
jgi:hypothetical protein